MIYRYGIFIFALLVALTSFGEEKSEHHVYIHLVGEDASVSIVPADTEKQDKVAAVATCESTPEEKTAELPAAAPVPTKSKGNMGLLFFVFVLAIFLGIELISKVPSQLHTPLMSGSNAISGITIVGALLAAGRGNGVFTVVLGVLAVAFAMINVVGGYMVTDRMLGMFKHKDGGNAS